MHNYLKGQKHGITAVATRRPQNSYLHSSNCKLFNPNKLYLKGEGYCKYIINAFDPFPIYFTRLLLSSSKANLIHKPIYDKKKCYTCIPQATVVYYIVVIPFP